MARERKAGLAKNEGQAHKTGMLKDVERPSRIRFTAVEVEQAASYGLDLRPVRSREDLV